MKNILIFLISIILNAQVISFINPFEINTTLENNNTQKDINITNSDTNISNDENTTQIIYTELNFTQNISTTAQTEILTDNFKTLSPEIKIAVIIDENKMKNYIKDIMNTLNAYFLYKNVNYSIDLYNINSFNEKLANKYTYIIDYTVNENLDRLKNYKNYLLFPILYKNDTNLTNNNFYFSGIDFKKQINKLSTLILKNNIIAINSNTYFSKKLTKLEKEEFNLTIFEYPNINYNLLKNKNIFFNTSSIKTAQILSKINYLDIKTSLQFATQINYDPILISLSQPTSLKNLIIANSIITLPKFLIDYNDNLYTNITFNWLNYTSNLLANKIYNLQTNSDKFFLNDFRVFIFNNQVDYKTNLYQIINGGFQKIY